MINGLKREELVALNSTLLHELYFASLGGDGRAVRRPIAEAIVRATSARSTAGARSSSRWRNALARRLGLGAARLRAARPPARQPVAPPITGRRVAGGIPILALDMYEHAYHIDFGANAGAYVDAFMRNIDWKRRRRRATRMRRSVAPPRPLVQKEFGDLPGVARRRR